MFILALHQVATFRPYIQALNLLSAQTQFQFNLSCLKVDCKTLDILGNSWPEEN